MVDVNRYAAIEGIADAANEVLLNSLGRSYLTIDTAFLSPKIPDMWHWFATEMKSLVETTRRVSEDTDPHRFARLFLVPDPVEQPNLWPRRQYRQVVTATLHFHLWHGVVCFVLFVSGRKHSFAALRRSVDFGAIGPKLTFDTSRFYDGDFGASRRLEGREADDHVRRAFAMLRAEKDDYIQLYYDDSTFEHRRRNQDKQWHEIRRLLIGLYDGRCQGLPECAHRGRKLSMQEIEIDHIVPLPHSNNVLLNLRPLCRQCNRLKARLDTTEMPFDLLFNAIPSHLATKDVKQIMSDQVPAWLPRYRTRPQGMRHYGARF